MSMIETQKEINNWQRRLSIDTVKQNSKQLAKMTSSHPLIVFNTMINNAKSYSNMIEAQVAAMQGVS